MNNMKFNLFIEKILSDIASTQNGKAVFIFGRMNPPTLGHELLISKAVEVSRKEQSDCYVILSKTQDNKKNPIPYDHKISAINDALPNVNFIDSENIKTIFDAVQFLIDKGYTDLTLVCGSDRAAEYNTLFNKYINNPDPEKRLNLTNFKTAVAGANRDPDGDDASGVSATKARNLAKAGDYESFKKILPTKIPDDQAKILFNDIRSNLK